MKTHKIIVTISIVLVLCFAVKITACPPPPPPVADLKAIPDNVALNDSVILDGSSSHGSITKYEWEWDYNGVTFSPDHNETPGDKKAEHIYYDTNGVHIAALRVTANGQTDIDTCTVKVITRVRNIKQGKDYSYIQPAINEAVDFDVIEVNVGTYKENIDFLGKKITLRSTDTNDWNVVSLTIIEANDSNKAAVIFKHYEDACSVIAGFTIAGGLHGIECNYTSPVIQNCIIKENGKANGWGGGIYDCNSAAPLITNCFIVDNDANYGAGIYNVDSNAIIRNCVISKNIAEEDGGGIYNLNCSPHIVNCTITDNDANNGGGMCCYGASLKPQIANCIFWDNKAADDGNEIYNADNAVPIFSYCDVKGGGGSENWDANLGQDGGGNINSDPNFTNLLLSDANLVSHWKFDENEGATAYDSEGDNNGNIQNATWTTGKVGSALDFDGTDDSVRVLNDSSLNITGDITIAAWVYFEEGGLQVIVAKTVTNGARNSPYDFRTDGSDEPRLILVRADGSGHEYVTSTKSISLNLWHHVVVTVSNNNVDFYVDGDITGKVGELTRTPTANSNPMYIGRRDSGLYFNGKIDNVMIFKRALSSQEIQHLYYNYNYKYRLDSNSPCINAGDPDTDTNKAGLFDIDNEPRIMWSGIEIGADEVDCADINALYATSFENYQNVGDNWKEDGRFLTGVSTERFDDSNVYQYTSIYDESVYSGNFDGSRMQYIRFSCIPSKDSSVNILNGTDKVASIHFDPNDNHIHIWDGGHYSDTNIDCENAMTQALYYLKEVGEANSNYSYKYSWINFEIVFDWNNCNYDVFWSYWDGTNYHTREVIRENAEFDRCYSGFTDIEFANQIPYDDANGIISFFGLNRVSFSNEPSIGGQIGESNDVYIYLPVADPLKSIKGKCELVGSVWYDELGYYVIKYCATDQNIAESANWTEIARGSKVLKNGKLGNWNTSTLKNGDYYLRVDLYNDIGLLHESKIISRIMSYNNDAYQKEVNSPFSVYTKLQGGTFYYEEKPDITVNWPGQFPFEFKRTYNSNRTDNMFPLMFGWAHNHDIKLYEDCTFYWTTNGDAPAGDSQGLGIGRIWLMNSGSSSLYTGYVDPNDSSRAIYKSALENDSIVRTSNTNYSDPNAPKFSVSYTYYGRDGIEIEFNRLDANSAPFKHDLNYIPPSGEGAVDWSVFVGATEKRDRFGNALNYDWYYYEGETPIYVSKITNNRTSAYIEFEMRTDYPFLYNRASLKIIENGNPTEIMAVSYDMDIGTVYAGVLIEKSADRVLLSDDPNELKYKEQRTHGYKNYNSWYEKGKYLMANGQPSEIAEEDDGQEMDFIVGYDLQEAEAGVVRISDKVSKKSQQGQHESVDQGVFNLLMTSSSFLEEVFEYTYDAGNNLKTISSSYDGIGQRDHRDDPHEEKTPFKVVTTLQNTDGAVLSEKTQTCLAGPFDINNVFELFGDGRYLYPRINKGGIVDASWSYQDLRFPTRPTMMIECFDDNGDGVYDRPNRKTTMKYDPFGNLIERRIYVDDVNFTASQWQYHPLYDLPIRQTTWQGYCYDNGGNIVPSGKKIETLYIYGNADGSVNTQGKFLLQKKVLLDDKGTTIETDDDTWAITHYTWYDNGLIRSETDPAEDITFCAYDANGFKTRIWRGASLNVNGDPIGYPQERFYYDQTGQCLLQADSFGAVTMNIYNGLGRIEETKRYHDVTAVSRADFNTAVYDNPDIPEDDNNFDSRKQYRYYNLFDKDCRYNCPNCPNCWPRVECECYEEDGTLPSSVLGGVPYVKETLDTGGTVRSRYDYGFYKDFPAVFTYDDNSVMYTRVKPDNQPFQIKYVPEQEYFVEEECEDNAEFYDKMYGGLISGSRQDITYDSMDRPIYKMWRDNVAVDFNCYITSIELTPYRALAVKFQETDYWGDGNKRFEKTYKVTCYKDFNDIRQEWEWCYTKTLEQYVDYEYDKLGRLINQIDHNDVSSLLDSPRITSFGYDAAGNRIYVIDPNGNVTFTDYDNANRKVKEYFPTEPVIVGDTIDIQQTKANAILRQKIEYYNDSKVAAVTMYDNNGITILTEKEFTYDARGRLQDVNERINTSTIAQTAFYYRDASSSEGLLGPAGDENYHVQIKDAENQSTFMQLNEFGMTKKILYPDGRYELTEYSNEYGKKYILPYKKTVWDNNGVERQLQYEYDDYGKVSKIIYPDGGYLEYEYGPRCFGKYGRVKSVKDYRNAADRLGDAGTTYEYTYDVFDRITSYNDSNEFIVSCDLRAADNQKYRIKVAYADDPNQVIYDVNYAYNLLGQMQEVYEPGMPADGNDANDLNVYIASMQYDDNGNRKQLKYYLAGDVNDPNTTINYSYNIKNNLIGITAANSSGEPNYTFDVCDVAGVDGLGRLKHAVETISYPGQSNRSHTLTYNYNMQNSLVQAGITNINGLPLMTIYGYKKDGNISQKGTWYGINPPIYRSYKYDTTPNNGSDFDSDIMTKAGDDELDWDENGRLVATPTIEFNYNWDGKLRSAVIGANSILLKYDPMGNRVYKASTVNGNRRYIVDIAGGLPVILCEIDDSNGSITNKYYYANAQILKQDSSAGSYYYIHDRLGSVRLVIDTNSTVRNSYTYNPFGEMLASECNETVYNPFKFTGQWYDSEIGQYYLRARMYDPVLMRFTARDTEDCDEQEPLALHRYLYCGNDSINCVDPTGEYLIPIAKALLDATTNYAAGLTVATIGAENLNFDLIIAGSFIQQMSGLVFAISYATHGAVSNLDGIVSRWGSEGPLKPGDWVMKGPKSRLNYILSGKWQPAWMYGKNRFASYSSGKEFLMEHADDVKWPSGVTGFLKGLLCNQGIYNP